MLLCGAFLAVRSRFVRMVVPLQVHGFMEPCDSLTVFADSWFLSWLHFPLTSCVTSGTLGSASSSPHGRRRHLSLGGLQLFFFSFCIASV